MRIVHATDVFYPSSGGLERSVLALAQRQSLDGHDVLIATPRIPGRPHVEFVEGVEVRRLLQSVSRFGVHLSPLQPFCPPFPDPELVWDFKRLFEEWRPEIVHCHGLIVHSVLGPARHVKAAVIAGAHDYSFVCAKKTLLRDGSICPGPKLATCVKCASRHFGPKGAPGAIALYMTGGRLSRAQIRIAVSSAVANYGSSPNPRTDAGVRVVPTFINESDLSAAATAPPPPWAPERPFIFFAGALSEHKGIWILLHAHQRLVAQGVDVDLVIAGLPQDISVDDLRAPRVHVVMNASHPEVLGAWRAASVGVHPAVWGEPCSLAVIECLASGTPMVATNVGGNPDLLDQGSCGVLVPPGDSEALASAIRALLEDPDERHRLGVNGMRRANLLGLDKVWPQLEALYWEAIALAH
jgi:glycosyltransferase involved in cell wall biosynthesis